MSSFFVKFWRGQIPLLPTFWFGWAAPPLGIFIVLMTSETWLLLKIGITSIFVLAFLAAMISVISAVAVWRSAGVYAGHKFFKVSARVTSVLGTCWYLFSFLILAYVFVMLSLSKDSSHDENRIAEKTAIPSVSHPMAGFWKTQSSDNFGLAISPSGTSKYSVSFCGPGGCFKPGTYRPDTKLVDDKDYQVLDQNTIRVRGQDGFTTYHRAPSRGEECTENK